MLVARLNEAGLRLTVRDTFSAPTLAALAERIDAHTGEAAAADASGEGWTVPPNAVPEGCERLTPELLPLVALGQEHLDSLAGRVPGGAANIADVYPLVPSQEGILFHHLMDPENDPYVMSAAFTARDEAACTAFTDALQTVVDRHDVMRTAVFTEGLPEPVQVVLRSAELPVDRISLTEEAGDAGDAKHTGGAERTPPTAPGPPPRRARPPSGRSRRCCTPRRHCPRTRRR